MPLTRRLTRTLAWLVAACLLFAQSTAIAHACSRGDTAAAAAGAIVAAPCSAHFAADEPPASPVGGPLAQGNVCEVHCQTPSLPDGGAMDLPSIVIAAAWLVPVLAAASDPKAPAPELEARSAAPPLLALFPRLLI